MGVIDYDLANAARRVIEGALGWCAASASCSRRSRATRWASRSSRSCAISARTRWSTRSSRGRSPLRQLPDADPLGPRALAGEPAHHRLRRRRDDDAHRAPRRRALALPPSRAHDRRHAQLDHRGLLRRPRAHPRHHARRPHAAPPRLAAPPPNGGGHRSRGAPRSVDPMDRARRGHPPREVGEPAFRQAHRRAPRWCAAFVCDASLGGQFGPRRGSSSRSRCAWRSKGARAAR